MSGNDIILSAPKDFVLPFLEKEQLTKDTYTFYFDRSKSPEFDFIPGQYIKMTLDIPQPDERGVNRLFTLSSSPMHKNYITITTRVIQSSFKKTLLALQPHTLVKFYGPMGRFLYDNSLDKPSVFLAGGIGLTPFHSILTSLTDVTLAQPIYFFVSFSTIDEIVFYDELTAVAEKNKQIYVIYTITHPSTELPLQTWKGQTGRVSKEMIEQYAGSGMDRNVYYLVGPKAMVDALEKTLLDASVPPEQIRKENFVGY